MGPLPRGDKDALIDECTRIFKAVFNEYVLKEREAFPLYLISQQMVELSVARNGDIIISHPDTDGGISTIIIGEDDDLGTLLRHARNRAHLAFARHPETFQRVF